MKLKNVHRARISILLLAVMMIPFSTAVGQIFVVSGDIFDRANTNVGSFSLTINSANLTQTLVDGSPGLGADLEIGPWYGYDITAATLVLPQFSLDASHVIPTEPAVGGPSADVYFEGTPIESFSGQDFAATFSTSLSLRHEDTFLMLGSITAGAKEVIFNEVQWHPANGDYFFGEMRNVSVSQFSAVPEPATYGAILGGLTVIALGVRRRVKQKNQSRPSVASSNN